MVASVQPLYVSVRSVDCDQLTSKGGPPKRGRSAPLEAAARFHHRLVQIHPFPNGNDRHARISADLYLSEYYDYGHIDWNGGQSLVYNNARRDEYIAALRAADRYNLNLLLNFVNLQS